MSVRDDLKRQVCEAIDAQREHIIELGEAIMDAPELGFKEVRTAGRVKKVLEDAGLPCRDQLAVTGVKAVLRGARPGPTVALMGELDALVVPDHPRADAETGAAHACGHNAQIAGMVGAALGLSAADIAQQLAGNIVFLAVPAEEYVEIDYRLGLVKQGKTSFLCGKAELLEKGHFDDVDMAIMIHSISAEYEKGVVGVPVSSNGFLAKNIRFVGKAAHAGVSPEQGSNALSAATLALHAIDAHRPTFRDEDCVRVHPIITKGGDLVNIIPAEVRMETFVRARNTKAMLDAAGKVDRALRGAALAIGCHVEIETVPGNLPLNNDRYLANIFKQNSERLFGEKSYHDFPHRGGSTDAGDLSQVMPVLHPYMMGAKGTIHGSDWHIADHENGYISPGKSLAMMAIDLLSDDAAMAKQVLTAHEPAFSREAYLKQQKALFHTEQFDGESA